MRAAIYARYSTDLQRASSIDDQVRSCRALIEKEHWTLVETYTDPAVTGTTWLRPGYQKLLEDVRNSQFDVVVAEALDRLSRDLEDIAALYKHLSFAGVKLLTIAEGEINELHVGLKGAMNTLFLKDLKVNLKRGLERVRQGKSGGGLAFGYRVVRQLDSRGELIRTRDEPSGQIGRRPIAERYIIKAAAYARFAARPPNGKDGDMINEQLHACRDYATQAGLEIVATYDDPGTSASDLQRFGLQNLLADAERGMFEIVLAEDLDRLARDALVIASLVEQLRLFRVHIVTLHQGEVDIGFRTVH